MRHVDDLWGVLSEGTLAERRSLIKSFVKEIEVRSGEALLRYTIPLPQGKACDSGPSVRPIVPIGGAEGTRTPDPLLAKQVLSQLSYSPLIELGCQGFNLGIILQAGGSGKI